MKKISLFLCSSLLSSSAILAETVDSSSYKSVITSIYMQSAMIAVLIAVVTIILVSVIDYDLVDSRRRSQKDVVRRRIVFFLTLLFSPILWFFTTSMFMYNNMSKTLGMYNWAPDDNWIGAKLIDAYSVSGTFILTIGFIISFILFAWLLKAFANKHKAWTVIYSNHKVFGAF